MSINSSASIRIRLRIRTCISIGISTSISTSISNGIIFGTLLVPVLVRAGFWPPGACWPTQISVALGAIYEGD